MYRFLQPHRSPTSGARRGLLAPVAGPLLAVPLAVLLGVVPPADLAGQLISPACQMNCQAILEQCSLSDAACHTRNVQRAPQVAQCEADQAACMTKLGLYNSYLGQMGMGVTFTGLPDLYREVLAPRFPGLNLGQWRFGFADRQPANNATTDCNRTHFNNSDFVSKLRQGNLDQDWEFRWLIHEIRHFGQCTEVGGRDFYSRMWWDDLGEADFATMLQSGDWTTIHSQMAMEQEAGAFTQSTWGAIAQCCIHPQTSRLIRPLEVGGVVVAQMPRALAQVQVSVQASGGADPLTYEWERRTPTDAQFAPFPPSEATIQGDRLTWTPRTSGQHQIRVRVRQATGAAIPFREAVQTVSVLPTLVQETPTGATTPGRVPVAPRRALEPAPLTLGLQLRPTRVRLGGGATLTVTLDRPAPRDTPVELSSSNQGLAAVPSQVVVRRGTTSTTARVTTSATDERGRPRTVSPRGTAVTIRAAFPGQRATEAVEVRLELMSGR